MAEHLIAAGTFLESDPELSYAHAQAAVARAGRVDVVREAAALAAYATGRYAEALREVRTVRRLSGVDAHRALEADCERGLGRPDRALTVLGSAPEATTTDERVERALVEAGARLDLGEPEAARSVLDRFSAERLDAELQERLDEVRVDVQAVLDGDESGVEPGESGAAGAGAPTTHVDDGEDHPAGVDGSDRSEPDAAADEEAGSDVDDGDVVDLRDLSEEA